MTKYQEIASAKQILGLPEAATLERIKSNYRRLMTRWHPDRGNGNQEKCHEMARKIIWAYQTILDYCRNYQYSFSEETVKRHRSPEEWWFERFGDDPVWGCGPDKEPPEH